MADPVLYLRSAAYVLRHRADFPAAYTIQARPRFQYGEGLDGRVGLLAPTAEEWKMGARLIDARRRGQPWEPDLLAAYRGSMETRWDQAVRIGLLRPGRLQWSAGTGMGGGLFSEISDGAALCCSCAAGAECHRRWAAPYLARAGWSVVLDGAPLP